MRQTLKRIFSTVVSAALIFTAIPTLASNAVTDREVLKDIAMVSFTNGLAADYGTFSKGNNSASVTKDDTFADTRGGVMKIVDSPRSRPYFMLTLFSTTTLTGKFKIGLDVNVTSFDEVQINGSESMTTPNLEINEVAESKYRKFINGNQLVWGSKSVDAQLNTWYHFDFILDYDADTLQMTATKVGDTTPILVGDAITISSPATHTKGGRVEFRVSGTKGMYIDNLCAEQYLVRAAATGAVYADGALKVSFDKDMYADSFTTQTTALYMGYEKIPVSYTMSYENKVLTVVPAVIKENADYTFELKSGVKCKDALDMLTHAPFTFTVPKSTGVHFESSVFAAESGKMSATYTLKNYSDGLKAGNALLAVYDADKLIASSSAPFSLEVGASSSLLNLSALYSSTDYADYSNYGAVLYLLDSNNRALCEPIVKEGSELTLSEEGSSDKSAENSFDQTTGEMTVCGTVPAGSYVTVMSFKVDDPTVTTDDAIAATPSAIRQTMARSNGYFETVFVNDETRFLSDDYTIKVFVENATDAVNLPYKFSNSREAENLLNGTGGVNNLATTTDVSNLITNGRKVFGLDLTDYNTITDKTAMHQLMLNEKGSATYTEGYEFKNLFDKAVAVALLNENTLGGNGILDILMEYGSLFPEIPADYMNVSGGAAVLATAAEHTMSADERELALRIMDERTYQRFANVGDIALEAKNLSIVSHAPDSSTLQLYLTDTYSDFFGVLASEENQTLYDSVNEKLAPFGEMLDVEFMTKPMLLSAFETALNTVLQNQASQGEDEEPWQGGSTDTGDSGSGGGGGGGGRKPSTTVVDVTIPTKTAEEKTPLVTFNDIDESDSKMLYTLVGKGVICGDGNGNFRPDDLVRRDEFSKMIVIACGLKTDGAVSEFSDVSRGNWAYPYVSALFDKKIINGVGDNKYGADYKIRREDAVTMLYRLAASENLMEYFKVKNTVAEKISDFGKVSDYARDAVLFAYGEIVPAQGSEFKPQEYVTRLEVAQMVYNFINLVQDGGAL